MLGAIGLNATKFLQSQFSGHQEKRLSLKTNVHGDSDGEAWRKGVSRSIEIVKTPASKGLEVKIYDPEISTGCQTTGIVTTYELSFNKKGRGILCNGVEKDLLNRTTSLIDRWRNFSNFLLNGKTVSGADERSLSEALEQKSREISQEAKPMSKVEV